jgi:hypothetical protein
MATILYKLVDDKPVTEKCEAADVSRLLEAGYSVDIDGLTKKPKRKVKAKVKSKADE